MQRQHIERNQRRLQPEAHTSIDRKDFGLTWNNTLETGGVLVGDRVDIELEVQAVPTAAAAKKVA